MTIAYKTLMLAAMNADAVYEEAYMEQFGPYSRDRFRIDLFNHNTREAWRKKVEADQALLEWVRT